MTMRDRAMMLLTLIGFAASLAVAPAAAQEPASSQEDESDDDEGEIALVYERESYAYQAGELRDPFASLVGVGIGPRLEDLTIRGLIYAEERSVVVLSDGADNLYRLRVGQTVGNAQVLDIQPTRVIFAVEEFGVTHRETLEYNRDRGQGTGQ